MPEYICDVCGKVYRSRSGLRDHRKSHRDAARPTGVFADAIHRAAHATLAPQDPGPEPSEGAPEAGPGGGPKINNKARPAALVTQAEAALGEGDLFIGPDAREIAWAMASSQADADLLYEACAALGIHPNQIMSFTVYPPDTVAIVKGPVGFKYTWTRGASR